ncbi:zinc finger protein 816 isoform X1 [Dendroctonus ponderosae]|uniref:Protein krueppel n=2 Tax=Dendroctonus ponderosae TaxID=77166 RepID=A0AAR5P3L3_DENPD|nr:zinc finger protein 816 isoform X1 [Dendroctonus ponderosae]
MTEKCRICLKNTMKEECICIGHKLNEDCKILQGIITLTSIQVLEADPLPQFICHKCHLKLVQLYSFRNLIISSDNELKSLLMKPVILNKNQKTELEEALVQDISIVRDELIRAKTEELNNCEAVNPKKERITLIRAPKVKTPKAEKLVRKYKCHDCEKTFKRLDHLNVHIGYRHSERAFKCERCNKKFARKYDLNAHVRIHTGEKPFTCEICGKSFASASYFYVHKKMHTGLKQVKCDKCECSFTNSNRLQIHVRQKHTGERPYLCELCSVAFVSSSALFRHKKDVHDEKVECPICRKLFSRRVLKEHIKRHREREEGIKRFSCDQCSKKFTCATSRKRHMVIHSGEKPHKCQICDKAFNQRSTLQTHMRIHSQIMPYQCTACTETYRYQHQLKSHIEKQHKTQIISENKLVI